MRATLRSVSLVAALVLAAGCASSGADDTTAITDVGASVATSTSVPATSTVEATTSTTVTTSTVEDPVAVAEAAAVEAVMEQGQLWRECTADPARCDTSIFGRTTTGDALDALVARVEQFQEDGFQLQAPADPGDQGREIVSVEVRNDGLTLARVLACTVDTSVLVQPGAAPDGSDVVIDDEVASNLNEAFVRLDGDGVWRVFRVSGLGSADGDGGCDGLLD